MTTTFFLLDVLFFRIKNPTEPVILLYGRLCGVMQKCVPALQFFYSVSFWSLLLIPSLRSPFPPFTTDSSGWLAGGFDWRYFPTLKGPRPTALSLSFFLVYLLLCLTPLFINRREARLWRERNEKGAPYHV